jgi:hypothetical protein
MKGRKLGSGLNSQGALKQKGVKQTGGKQGLGVQLSLYISILNLKQVLFCPMLP